MEDTPYRPQAARMPFREGADDVDEGALALETIRTVRHHMAMRLVDVGIVATVEQAQRFEQVVQEAEGGGWSLVVLTNLEIRLLAAALADTSNNRLAAIRQTLDAYLASYEKMVEQS